MNAHMNGCVHNVDAILKRAEVAEAKVKALEAQLEAQRKEAAIEIEKHRQSIDTTHRDIRLYKFHSPFTMQTLANNIAQCARLYEEPDGGWKAVYAELKEARTDWVRKRTNEPNKAL